MVGVGSFVPLADRGGWSARGQLRPFPGWEFEACPTTAWTLDSGRSEKQMCERFGCKVDHEPVGSSCSGG